jgi:hypothetical protein
MFSEVFNFKEIQHANPFIQILPLVLCLRSHCQGQLCSPMSLLRDLQFPSHTEARDPFGGNSVQWKVCMQIHLLHMDVPGASCDADASVEGRFCAHLCHQCKGHSAFDQSPLPSPLGTACKGGWGRGSGVTGQPWHEVAFPSCHQGSHGEERPPVKAWL